MAFRYSGFIVSFLLSFFLWGVTFAHAAPNAPKGADRCSFENFRACHTTNVLIGDPGTGAAMRKFFGAEPGNFLYSQPNVKAVNDAFAVLGGPPDRPVRLSGGLTLFAACRYRSCTEKGALLLGPTGKILAVGIAHFQCGKPDCDDDYTLTIFVRDKALQNSVRSILTDWFDDVRAKSFLIYPSEKYTNPFKVDMRVLK